VPLLSRRDDVHQGAALRVDCDSHDCPSCGPRKRSRWLLHLTRCLENHPGPVYHALLLDAELAARKKAVYRRGGKYAAVHRSGGRTLLVATVPLRGLEQTSPAGAAEVVAASLLTLARVGRPISTSEPWQLPAGPRRETEEYAREGEAPRGTFPKVVAEVERVADGVHHAKMGDKVGAFFRLPADWPAARAAAQYSHLITGAIFTGFRAGSAGGYAARGPAGEEGDEEGDAGDAGGEEVVF
jgi:hypothetical protein